jgi:tetratricopeptide (TPR) repeat protein
VLRKARVGIEGSANRANLAGCCRNLGVAYEKLGELDKAASSFDDALDEFAVLGDGTALGAVFQRLCKLHARRQNEAAYARLIEKMRPVFRAVGEKVSLLTCCLSSGATLSKNGKKAEAVAAFEEALDLTEELNIPPLMMHCFMCLPAQYPDGEQKRCLLERVQGKLGHEGMVKNAMQLVQSMFQPSLPGA